MDLTIKELWVRHIERFSDRLRGRLYAALIAYLYNGTEIPEKLMPYLGIILDLMAQEGITPAHPVAEPVDNTSESASLQQFAEETAQGTLNPPYSAASDFTEIEIGEGEPEARHFIEESGCLDPDKFEALPAEHTIACVGT